MWVIKGNILQAEQMVAVKTYRGQRKVKPGVGNFVQGTVLNPVMAVSKEKGK